MPKPDGIFNGTPVWIDLSTSDIAAASTFYRGLFGWNVPPGNESFGGYTMAFLDDAQVGGLMPKGPDEAGMPDAWTIYLASDDAEASSAAVKTAGGSVVMEPMDVGDFGRMAIATDPAGALFGIWQPNTHTGFGVVNEKSAPVWFELLSRDFPASTAFYPAAFGVEVASMGEGDEGPGYKTINAGGGQRAGIMDAANGVLPDGVPSNWSVCFGVEDTDAAVARAQELGGNVIAPPSDTSWGRFAMLADPTGAIFTIISV
jgi:predicted enzyme related to lactoylglutathione lyase